MEDVINSSDILHINAVSFMTHSGAERGNSF